LGLNYRTEFARALSGFSRISLLNIFMSERFQRSYVSSVFMNSRTTPNPARSFAVRSHSFANASNPGPGSFVESVLQCETKVFGKEVRDLLREGL
jgi:hypothetical protein